jgi:PhoPQ-activated pathogenicity-related protein
MVGFVLWDVETFLISFQLFLLFVAVAQAFVALPNSGLKFAREKNPSLQTPLDVYAFDFDSNAGYTVTSKTYRGNGFTAYVLDFKSQLWMPQLSSRPLWQHWLTVCIPDGKVADTAFMYMDGPNNSDEPDPTLYAPFYMMCSVMDGVVVYLQQCPNQPLSFPDHPGGMTEDDLIAYGWRKFLNGSAVDPR